MEDRRIAGLLNLLVWGSGYIYGRDRVAYGAGWFIAYMPLHIPVLTMGLEFFYTDINGILMMMGHILVSVLLGYDAYRGGER